MDLETFVAGTVRLVPSHPPVAPGPGSKLREFWSCLCPGSRGSEKDRDGCRHRNFEPESIFITQRMETILSIILSCLHTISHYSAPCLIATETRNQEPVEVSSSQPRPGNGLCPPCDQSQAGMERRIPIWGQCPGITDSPVLNKAQHTWATLTQTSTI